ncbi:MAG: sarcosine oxidase subunit alpha family protein [Hyphomicrobiaceae bacterium]
MRSTANRHDQHRNVAAGPLRLGNGGVIDRSRQIGFAFDGRHYHGHPGDTLASALLANDVHLVGRSFKYHRPRGIMTAGPEEPNALVELRAGARREPNTRATTIELYEGLAADSQNRWPSLRHDILSLNGLIAPALTAGFYYKTFMWPKGWWEKVYEPCIRRAAGLGRASGQHDPDTYEKAHLHCDVLVVGAGPAGLMAALAAGRSGARVVLAEEDFRLGGRLLSEPRTIDGQPCAIWARAVEAELATLPEVRIMRRTGVVAAYDHGTFAAIERVNDHLPEPPPFEPRQRLWRIIARQAIVATGAIECPLVFPDNDRPGIMLAGAASTYLNRYAVAPGRRVVVVLTDDRMTPLVDNLAKSGVDVAAVVDPAGNMQHAASAAERATASFHSGAQLLGVRGRRQVKALRLRSASGGRTTEIGCDTICVSGGWTPNIQLATHRGLRPAWNDEIGAFLVATPPAAMQIAGAANGEYSLQGALRHGALAGARAASETGFAPEAIATPECDAEHPSSHRAQPIPARHRKAFVDFQNDVTTADIAQSAAEGFSSPEHMKRYTTLGMATDQGKMANVNAMATLAGVMGLGMAETGTITYRPPITPVAIGALAGHHRGRDFRPTRLTPTHAWARQRGAVFVEAGQWLRPQWYPLETERDWLESVCREVEAVRNAVGICDVSTLGKIDLRGEDAASFLDRIYTGMMSTLAVGRVRYGVMLREDGFVMDDGTVARLGPDHFLITTTTANAARVMQHMEHAHQWHWPELDIHMTSVTDQWAQLAIAGPDARKVLQDIVDPGADVSADTLPFMATTSVNVLGGIPSRVFRISYSGELGYEIAIPRGHGNALARLIMERGQAYGITPYGTEALSVLRIEKGHVAGNEINGQTTALDLGLGRMLSKKKDFIGRVMARRPALVDASRPALVGLRPVGNGSRLRAGSHLLPVGVEATPAHDQGYVTSVAFSPKLGHWIALGLLAGGTARKGEHVRAYDPVRNGDVTVEVTEPVFYDPQGTRLHE